MLKIEITNTWTDIETIQGTNIQVGVNSLLQNIGNNDCYLFEDSTTPTIPYGFVLKRSDKVYLYKDSGDSKFWLKSAKDKSELIIS